MNVFFTNKNPIQAAIEHCFVHRRKMIVEYTQLLSTAHHVLDGNDAPTGIYKSTHVNHPSAVWVRQSKEHYDWVWQCAKELCRLYTAATDKVHKTEAILDALHSGPKNIAGAAFQEPPVAAPDEFKAVAVFDGAAVAYQQYLVSKFQEWQSRAKKIAVEFDVKPAWV